MPCKVSLLCQTTTKQNGVVKRIGGFSESLYSANNGADGSVYAAINRWIAARMALSSALTVCVGFRIQDLEIQGNRVVYGPAVAEDRNVPGTDPAEGDHPNMALRFALVTNGGTAERQYRICSVPDTQIVTGEFANANNYNQKVVTLFDLIRTEWRMLMTVRLNPLRKLMSIAAPAGNPAGVFVYQTSTAHGLVASDFVKFNRTHRADGTCVTEQYQVLDAPTASTFRLIASPFSEGNLPQPKHLGSVRKSELVLAEFYKGAFTTYVKSCTRKVGAPFNGFVGRS